jgi:hypothetical protein
MRVRYDLESTDSQQIALCSRGHRDYERQLLYYDVYRFNPKSAPAELPRDRLTDEGRSAIRR